MMPTSVQSFSTISSTCEVRNTVAPRPTHCRKVSRKTREATASTPSEGSSRIAHVLAENAHRAAAGREQAREHFDGRGFSRAIGSEESVELSCLDAKIELIDGAKFSKVPREVGGFNGWVHGVGDGGRL